MRPQVLARLLSDVKAGRVSPAAALERLRDLPFEDLGFARWITTAPCDAASRR